MKTFSPLLKWMHERHNIYVRKSANKPKPWTKDEILQRYKFTNVFRDLDKVSQDLIAVLSDHMDAPPGQLLFNIVAYRMFNHPATYTAIAGKAGWITRWDPEKVKAILQDRKANGYQNFTGAYIITNQGRKTPKHIMAVDSLTMMYKDRNLLASAIMKENRMEFAVERMQMYDMVGGFIAYEFACDFAYCKLLWEASDIDEWAHAGPGAKRGLNRLFGMPTKQGMTQDRALNLMRTLYQYVAAHGKFEGRATIHMREIEHSLCEFDKYERVRLGEGRPRGKYNGGKS